MAEFFCQNSYVEGMRDAIEGLQQLLIAAVLKGEITEEQSLPFLTMIAGALLAVSDAKEGK